MSSFPDKVWPVPFVRIHAGNTMCLHQRGVSNVSGHMGQGAVRLRGNDTTKPKEEEDRGRSQRLAICRCQGGDVLTRRGSQGYGKGGATLITSLMRLQAF